MPFVSYKVQSKPNASGTGLSVSLRKAKAGAAKMSIFLGAAIAEKLQWTAEDTLEILLGTENEHGMIRLRKSPDGSAIVKMRQARGGGYFVVQLGHIETFVNRTEEKRYCPFEGVGDGWVEIVLPRWSEETHPTKPRVAVATARPLPKPPARDLRPQGQRRSLTAELQGDPPRHRSALVQGTEERLAERRRLIQAGEEGRRASVAASVEARREERGAAGGGAVDPSAIHIAPQQRLILSALLDGQNHHRAELLKVLPGKEKVAGAIDTYLSHIRRKFRTAGVDIGGSKAGVFKLSAEAIAILKLHPQLQQP